MIEPSLPSTEIRVLSALSEIPRADWDRCANPGWTEEVGVPDASSGRLPFNPFLSWDFLQALEESGTVGARAGWVPRPLVLAGQDGTPAGVMPCYLKSHSQ